jgi:hypothetical protein
MKSIKSIKEIIITIMMFIAIIIASTMLTGCGLMDNNIETKSTEYKIKGHPSIKIVNIDGCEYLYGDWGNATVLTHKGNCINHKDSIK